MGYNFVTGMRYGEGTGDLVGVLPKEHTGERGKRGDKPRASCGRDDDLFKCVRAEFDERSCSVLLL